MFLAHDSNENLTGLSYTSDVSNPPSRRNSIGANDHNQVCLIILNKIYLNIVNNFIFHRMVNLKMVCERIHSIGLLVQNIQIQFRQLIPLHNNDMVQLLHFQLRQLVQKMHHQVEGIN